MAGNSLRGALLAGTGTVLAGTSFAATSLLTNYPFLSGQALRFAIGALALAAILLWTGVRWPRPTARELAMLALLAATGLVGFNLASLAALRSSEPAALGVVVGCTPLVVALAGPLMARRRLSTPMLGAALLVVVGAAMVVGLGSTTSVGFGFALLAMLGETAFTVLAVPVLPRLGALVVSAYVCVLAAVEMAVLALVVEFPQSLQLPTSREVLALGYLAIAITAVAFICYYAGIQRLGAERTSLFAGLIPVASAFAAPVVGTGALGPAQVLGSLLVGIGITVGMAVVPATATAPMAVAGTGRTGRLTAQRRSPVPLVDAREQSK